MEDTGLQYKYGIVGNNEDFEDAYEVKSKWLNNIEYVAEDAAEDYHNNHDGYDDIWPIVFIIWDLDGKELGRFDIEREYDPVFFAIEVKKESA